MSIHFYEIIKKVLPSIISTKQAGFVQGRSITENIIFGTGDN